MHKDYPCRASKLSLKPTVNRCIENIQRSFCKLEWLRNGGNLSKDILKRWFLRLHLPLRLVHYAPFVNTENPFLCIHEDPLDKYVKRCISKRLNNMFSPDLIASLFLEDLFFWDNYHKQEKDGVGYFFTMKRVNRLKARYHSLLLTWLEFVN